MSGRDPHQRARSDDRSAAVDLIEAAFADRQITPEDRDLRLGNALLAQTLGELDMLTRDLERPSAAPAEQLSEPPSAPPHVPPMFEPQAPPPGPGFPVGPPAYAPPPQHPTYLPPPQQAAYVPPPHQPTAYAMPRRPTPRRQRPVLALFVLALVLASVGASAVFSALRDVDLGFDPEDLGIGQVDDTYELTAAGMTDFLDLYKGKFGHRTALNATFYDEYVLVDVPTADGKSRHETWFYRDAEWQRTSGATANVTGDVAVNLAKVNLSKLEANIAQAKAALGVEEPTLVYVLVGHGWTGKANTAAIHVQNEFGEHAFMTTNLAGRVLQRYRFQGR